MSADKQLALDGAAPREVDEDFEVTDAVLAEVAETEQEAMAAVRDRLRVSGLFVQPREHNDPEEERGR